MDMPLEERRQIENEMIFRRANEKVGDSFDDLDAMHIEDNNPHLTRDKNMTLEFKCECSDENCDVRIRIKLTDYQKIHINRGSFVIKPKHQVKGIEKVIATKSNYSVVKKNKSTKEPGDKLNRTSISNT